MSDAESAKAILNLMRRAQALQEHINLLGAGPPDPCKDLRAAARLVVDAYDHPMRQGDLVGAISKLRTAVEAAAGGE